jgi:hypothetical protein
MGTGSNAEPKASGGGGLVLRQLDHAVIARRPRRQPMNVATASRMPGRPAPTLATGTGLAPSNAHMPRPQDRAQRTMPQPWLRSQRPLNGPCRQPACGYQRKSRRRPRSQGHYNARRSPLCIEFGLPRLRGHRQYTVQAATMTRLAEIQHKMQSSAVCIGSLPDFANAGWTSSTQYDEDRYRTATGFHREMLVRATDIYGCRVCRVCRSPGSALTGDPSFAETSASRPTIEAFGRAAGETH